MRWRRVCSNAFFAHDLKTYAHARWVVGTTYKAVIGTITRYRIAQLTPPKDFSPALSLLFAINMLTLHHIVLYGR
jgi:hypothetical protein